ncbi:MAG: hypothetical protein GY810_09000 [Aureispira sp.]|nr:hypothetical protein [Aureispira sp.]
MIRKALVLILFIVGSNFQLSAQSLETFSSLVIQHYYNYPDRTTQSEYKPGFGASVGVGINDINLKVNTLRLTMRYLYYTSQFSTLWGGLDNAQQSYWVSHDAKIKNHSLSFGVYPFNVKWFKKRFVLSIGAEIELLVGSRVEGERVYEDGIGTRNRFDLSSEKINNGAHVSAVAQLEYRWDLGNGWKIVPAYCTYIGLTNQFGGAYMGVAPKPIKHLITVAVHKNLFFEKEHPKEKKIDNI